MYNSEKTLKAIRKKCQEVLLKWEILDRNEETKMVIVSNPKTKVSLKSELMEEDGHIYAIIYKVTDQESIIRPLRGTVIFYTDGEMHCEYSGFKSEEDILQSLNK